MALTRRQDAAPMGALTDDYLVEGEEQLEQPTIGAQAVQGLQIMLIGVMAVLSLGIFCMLGLLFNIL
jgi:hypothetical protein